VTDDPRGGAALAAVLALFSGAAVAGCSGPRGGSSLESLTGQASACASALPVARQTVAGRGRLVVIRPLTKNQAVRLVLLVTAGRDGRAPRPSPVTAASCLLIYRGSYAPASVKGADGAQGKFVLLVVRVRHPKVLGVYVLDKIPRGV
jgi:hypothetical protein